MANKKDFETIAEEVSVIDDMLSSLVEILEEKGVLTQSEWEARIENRLKENANLTPLRNLKRRGSG